MKVKRLTRTRGDRIIAGVCGGIGEYLAIDPTLIRLGWIIIAALSGFFPGIVAYVVAALIIPERA